MATKVFLKRRKNRGHVSTNFSHELHRLLIISTYPFMILLDKIISSSRLINIFAV